MKALVLQMRGMGDASRKVEQQQYLRCTGLERSQVDFVDLYEYPRFSPDQLLAYDLLFVGGISRDRADELDWPQKRFPFIHQLYATLQLAIDRKVPALLSCGGFAIAGALLGAGTLAKPVGFELGVSKLWKTAAAERDPLLETVPDGFQMVVGHVKYFEEAPPGTDLLLYTNAYGPRIPVHAFKVVGAPFYAFQGHPEISSAELADRVRPMAYRKHYFPKRPDYPEDERAGYNVEAFTSACALAADTSEAQALLRRFVRMVGEGQLP